MISAGQKAPGFCLPDKDEKEVCLKDFAGKWVVLYFYPKDNTSGCTLEAVNFSAAKDEFGKLGAEIVGVSVDSAKSHRGFADKHSLGITLLSDADRRVVAEWGVWGKKKLYGKEYEGTIRSTFLIGPDQTVRHAWEKVSVPDHVTEVLERLRSLQ